MVPQGDASFPTSAAVVCVLCSVYRHVCNAGVSTNHQFRPYDVLENKRWKIINCVQIENIRFMKFLLTLHGRIVLIIGLLLSSTYAYCYAHNSRTYYQQDTNHNHYKPCHIHAKHGASGLIYTKRMDKRERKKNRKLYILQHLINTTPACMQCIVSNGFPF